MIGAQVLPVDREIQHKPVTGFGRTAWTCSFLVDATVWVGWAEPSASFDCGIISSPSPRNDNPMSHVGLLHGVSMAPA
jgi:hypothetical protein